MTDTFQTVGEVKTRRQCSVDCDDCDVSSTLWMVCHCDRMNAKSICRLPSMSLLLIFESILRSPPKITYVQAFVRCSLYGRPIVSQCDLNNSIVIFTISEAENCTENHYAWNNCYVKEHIALNIQQNMKL